MMPARGRRPGMRWALLIAPLRLALVSALLIAVAPSVAAQGSSASATDVSDLPTAARRALFRAQGFLQDNQPEQAVEVLESYLREGGAVDHPILRSYLAAGLAQVGRTEDALAAYRHLARIEPDEPQHWLRIGELGYNLGRYTEAAEAFLAGQRLLAASAPAGQEPAAPAGPPHVAAGALYYAAVSLLLAGDVSRALPILEDLAAGRHGPAQFDWHRSLIAAQLEQGLPADAEVSLARLVEQFGGDPRAWLLVAQHAAEQGDYRRAAGALTLVGYLRPLSTREQIQLGDLYAAAGVPLAAAALYEQALGDSSSVETVERLATAYLAAHRPADAYAALQQAAHLAPRAGRVRLLLGYCALELGRREEAVRHLAAAAAADSADSTEAARARDLLRQLTEGEPELAPERDQSGPGAEQQQSR